MEQPGEVPEPEEPAALPTPCHPPTEPNRSLARGLARLTVPDRSLARGLARLPVPDRFARSAHMTEPLLDEPGPDGRGFLVAGILVLVAIVGVVAWLARPDDALDTVAREEDRFPAPTTIAPAPAPVPATAVVEATDAPARPRRRRRPCSRRPRRRRRPPPSPTAAPGTAPPSTRTTRAAAVPGDHDLDGRATCRTSPGSSRPSSGSRKRRRTPTRWRPTVAGLLTAGRHDVAVTGPVAAVCRDGAAGSPARPRRSLGARRPAHRRDGRRAPGRPRLRRVPDRRGRRSRRGLVPVRRRRLRRASSRPRAASWSARRASISGS